MNGYSDDFALESFPLSAFSVLKRTLISLGLSSAKRGPVEVPERT